MDAGGKYWSLSSLVYLVLKGNLEAGGKYAREINIFPRCGYIIRIESLNKYIRKYIVLLGSAINVDPVLGCALHLCALYLDSFLF